MKFLLPIVTGLALCTMSLRADAVQQEGQDEDLFLTAQKGDSDDAYASAYSPEANPQLIELANTFTPIKFLINDVKPQDIRHPSAGEGKGKKRFEIKEGGVYLVAWQFSVADANEQCGGTTIQVQLFNVKTGSAIAPSPLCRQFIRFGGIEVVAGNKLLKFHEGDIIRLQVLSEVAGVSTITFPAIAFTKVAD